jgi:hypothetical protein
LSAVLKNACIGALDAGDEEHALHMSTFRAFATPETFHALAILLEKYQALQNFKTCSI